MRLLYTLLLYLSLPLVLSRLLWRARRSPGYARRWRERFGHCPPVQSDKTVVWLHTVSVGEFLAALPLIRALQQQPDLQLAITTTTPTGSQRVRAELGDSVWHSYTPYDLPHSLSRFLDRLQPRLLVIMETELWPNTIAACARREIPVLLINARLSARSARGYQRIASLSKGMLRQLSAAAIQHRDDAARFQALGLPMDRAHITGNIKFDLTLDEGLRQQAARLRQQWRMAGRPLVWIAASTHLGEDEQLLEAFNRVRDSRLGRDLLLVLVPRHPERFDRVAQLCENRGLVVARRGLGEVVQSDTDVLLGDTMGELLLLYGAADLAFVGGSLVPSGGHNLIEPAAWGLPLISGPHLFNFAEVSRLLEEAGGLLVVHNLDQLANGIQNLLDNAQQRAAQGEAALAVANANRGALEKTLELIRQYL